MGTGVESSWEGRRQNHPEPELRARLVLSPLPRALISMLVLSSAWLPRQRGDLMLFLSLHCPRWVPCGSSAQASPWQCALAEASSTQLE